MQKILLVLCFVTFALAQCPSNPLRPGLHTLTMGYDGRIREYDVHVPTRYNNTQPYAFLLALHAYTTTKEWFRRETGFSDYADEENNFIVVYPQGVGDSWNAGTCCGTAVIAQVDDYGWMRALVPEVASKVCVDLKRVYVTGFSNGCFMSQGLVCKAPDMFAGSGCGSGAEILTTDCDRDFDRFDASLNILNIHGTDDALVPYYGNIFLGFPPVQSNFEDHAKRLNCQNGPRETFDEGDFMCEEYYNCDGGKVVELCLKDGGHHAWFDDREFSNSEKILDFFGLRAWKKGKRYVRPEDHVNQPLYGKQGFPGRN